MSIPAEPSLLHDKVQALLMTKFSLTWSIALYTQELYTWSCVLKEKWQEKRTGISSLDFFQAVFLCVVVESSQPTAAESMSPR